MQVKTEFSIKDLENLSGVKAHTIRIWEKRYNLLEPDRTDTNIRKYDLRHLKKLLNVAFLYNEGHKISKIAELGESEIQNLIKEQSERQKEIYAIQSFKQAMFAFDSQLFSATYKKLTAEQPFNEIFFQVFLPLLEEIGLLWQTGTIDPAHERFISELIKQKIIIHIEEAQSERKTAGPTLFTLYLPYGEIHEIGLLYANYEILRAGFKTIYLGANIPLDNLKHIRSHHDDVIFLSYFTVTPERGALEDYLTNYQNEICGKTPCEIWLMGQQAQALDKKSLAKNRNVSIISSINQLTSKLESLKISQI
ncbi:MAG: MerR family transcriptional regulator [Flavobacteriaceae bacterium]|nr:MerR family transcriptional regulator [Flavobacteriaceae bacterium]